MSKYKICNTCLEEKPIERFRIHQFNKGYRRRICANCEDHKNKVLKRYKDNINKTLEDFNDNWAKYLRIILALDIRTEAPICVRCGGKIEFAGLCKKCIKQEHKEYWEGN